jgi:hypothetical protein
MGPPCGNCWQAKREHLAETEVLALRQREAVPILEMFQTWLDRMAAQNRKISYVYPRTQRESSRGPPDGDKLQAFVEKIHAHWPTDRNYMAPPRQGKLVSLDPALLVTPPKGMERGFVPIVTRQEKAP